MRKAIVTALVLGLLAGSMVAPADAKKKKKKPPAPVAVDVKYFFHNDSGGDCGDDLYTLMLSEGADGTHCGTVTSGPVNEVFVALTGQPCEPTGEIDDIGCSNIIYNAIEGVPFVLDATKPVTGTIFVSSFFNEPGIGAGPSELVIAVRGEVNGEVKEIGTTSVEYTAAPDNALAEVPFEIAPPAELNLAQFTSFSVDLYNKGAAPLHGFYQTSDPASFVIVPQLQTPAAK